MTQRDPQQKSSSSSSRPIWILWVVAGALVLGCLCSLGALFLLRQADTLDRLQDLWPRKGVPATPTSAPTLTIVSTPTTAARSSATATSSATVTSTATATWTATATRTPTAAATPSPTPTSAPTRSAPTTEPSPTPFVCDSIYELANIQLAPGQTFQCTLQEEELTDLANSYADSPCSETRITFDDGEIGVECRIVVLMRAVLVPKIEECRVALEIARGTPAFRQIVKEMITTQFDVIKYDTICIDQLEADDGEVIVGGYGR